MNFHLEYHPENGNSPCVVVGEKEKVKLWFAYPTMDISEKKLVQLQNDFKFWDLVNGK